MENCIFCATFLLRFSIHSSNLTSKAFPLHASSLHDQEDVLFAGFGDHKIDAYSFSRMNMKMSFQK